jgi:glycosyltransferase involved in cell wall biosynthesis
VLSVIVPCLDEAENVARFGTELLPALPPDSEIILVDDGSNPPLEKPSFARVLRHDRNRGLGAALRTGFSEAKGDWILTLDADLTFSPSLIPALLAKQKETGADLVSGSPWLGGFSGVPLRRKAASLLLNAFYRGFLSPSLTAYTSIFRLYRASALKSLELSSEGFEINAEIAAAFVRAGLKTAEIPAELAARRRGVSKLEGRRELGRHAALVGRLLWNR